VRAHPDLVLLRADTPATDSIGAILRSADTSRVDTVPVAGRVAEREGLLLGHPVPAILAALEESAAHLAA
jgi:hypothetical protein